MSEKNVVVTMGAALSAASAAIKAWKAAEGGKTAVAAVTGGQPKASAIDACKALEALFRVCRSRAGSAAQNALLDVAARGNEAVASDATEFGIGS